MNAVPSAHSRIRFFGLGVNADEVPGLDDVGGKGINLCKLTAAKFPVPPGFVIATEAYRQFVAANRMGDPIRALAEAHGANNAEGRETISAKIRALFAENPIPEAIEEEIRAGYRRLSDAGGERVAVRSSATAEDLPEATFAGQQDTYLNVGGEASVLKTVKACWGSLWTARAMAYRAKQRTGMDGLAMAVVVQQMAPAEAAGVMFTANPITGAADELVVNAAWGLGEAVVGGKVTPDSMVVEKTTGKIKAVTVSEKTVMTSHSETGTQEIAVDASLRNARVLDDAAVARLAELGRRIEQFYGAAQDIEWAMIAGGQFAILQSRPIRGLDILEDTEVGRKRELHRLRELAAGRRKIWVAHNLGETLPAPTPLTWDIVRGFMSGNGGFGRMYRDFGYQPSPRVCETGFLELICGRVYADPERAAELFWAGMPLGYDLDALTKDPKLLDAAPARFDPERADGRFLLSLPRLLRQMLACSRRMKAIRATVVDRFERERLPPYVEWVREKRQQDLTRVSVPDLVRELDARIDRVLGDFGGESLKPAFFGGIAEVALSSLLTQLLGKDRGTQLAMTLVQGLDGDTTAEQATALFHVARGELEFESFMERFGHRAVEEMELLRPRWREDASYVNQILDAYRDTSVSSPETMHDTRAARRREAEAQLPELLRECGGSCLLEELLVDIKDAQKMLPYRESGKFYLMMGYETIRQVLVELAKRWDLGEDLFFLTLADLPSYESRREELAAIIAARKLRWQSARRLEMPGVIDSAHLEEMGLPRTYASATELTGEPVAPGVATGIATIVFDPQKAAGLHTDYILVCPSTDPAWTALFVHAKGLVVERGGALSHGAIVARDFGIPAVVCPDATHRIPDRTRVRVDGGRGVITLLAKPTRDGVKP